MRERARGIGRAPGGRGWRGVGGLAVALALAASLLPLGCRGVPFEEDTDKPIAKRLIGRWRGEPVDAPSQAWWQQTAWDVVVSQGGELSAIATSVVGARAIDLTFRGRCEVRGGELWVRDDPNLAGRWAVGFVMLEPLVRPIAPAADEPADKETESDDEAPSTARDDPREVLELRWLGKSERDPLPEAAQLRLRLRRHYGL